jgi:hypothetical protein
MNLQEQISRIQEMMFINENRPSANVLRRLPIVQKLLDITLENSYPCDFISLEHFTEGILYDIDTFLITYEMEGLPSWEVKEFISEHLSEEIRRYYIDGTEDC